MLNRGVLDPFVEIVQLFMIHAGSLSGGVQLSIICCWWDSSQEVDDQEDRCLVHGLGLI